MSPLGCERNGICSVSGASMPCEVIRFITTLTPSLQIEKDSEAICAMAARREMGKGKPLQLIAASSFYIGCRKNLTPITLKELAAISGIRYWEIGQETSRIVKLLHLELPLIHEGEYVSVVLSKLNQDSEMREQAMAIIDNAKAAGLDGKNPMTLAGAAVYAACLMNSRNVTQTSVADAAGISVVSIRDCFKELRKMGGLQSLAD